MTLSGIEMEVGAKPEGAAVVNTAKVLTQIPTAAFTGSVNSRDKMVLQLLQKGKDANASGEYAQACAYFEAAYALSMRGGMLVSAANMRLKLSEAATAAAMYRVVLSDSGLLAPEREMAQRKLAEATALAEKLPPPKGTAGGGGGKSSSSGGRTASSGGSGNGNGGWDAFGGGGDDGGFGANFEEPSRTSPPRASQPSFAADFGDASADFEDGFGDFDEPPSPPKPKPAAARPAPPPAAGGFAAFGDSGGFDADFGDFDDEPNGSPAAPPPAPAAPPPAPPTAARPKQPTFAADFGDAGFDAAAPSPPPAAPLHSAAHVVSGRGGGGGSGIDSEDAARLEARLARLEETMRGGPSQLVVQQHSERIDQLHAQVDRSMKGVRKGMEGLNGRIAAIEIAMAKLPEHLKNFSRKCKDNAKLGKEHAEAIAALQLAMPGLSTAAGTCHARIADLQQLSDALQDSPEAAMAVSTRMAEAEASRQQAAAAGTPNATDIFPAAASSSSGGGDSLGGLGPHVGPIETPAMTPALTPDPASTFASDAFTSPPPSTEVAGGLPNGNGALSADMFSAMGGGMGSGDMGGALSADMFSAMGGGMGSGDMGGGGMGGGGMGSGDMGGGGMGGGGMGGLDSLSTPLPMAATSHPMAATPPAEESPAPFEAAFAEALPTSGGSFASFDDTPDAPAVEAPPDGFAAAFGAPTEPSAAVAAPPAEFATFGEDGGDSIGPDSGGFEKAFTAGDGMVDPTPSDMAADAAAAERAAIDAAAKEAAAAADASFSGFDDFDEGEAEAEAEREMALALAAAKRSSSSPTQPVSSSPTAAAVDDSPAGSGGDALPMDEAAALDAELEEARRERERVQMELAADSFLTSLAHDADPKETERRAATSDLASECSVDDAAFTSLAAPNATQSFDGIGATVTDDEFNALFGPTE